MAQILFLLFVYLPSVAQQDDPLNLEQTVIASFAKTHQGYSSDEVILNDKLNQKFIGECQRLKPDSTIFQCNWKLMNLRKAGKLSQIKTTVRSPAADDKYQVLAEIASRSVLDESRFSIDRVMADPKWRKEFDQHARELDPDVDLYSVRKAAFKLRKTRKLRPELITRIADWNRKISKFTISNFINDNKIVPRSPGIYIFHDETGYLYIGHSENLRSRLHEHLNESSNAKLASHLSSANHLNIHVEIHAFPPDSRMKEVVIRRAYESELIRSRKPKYNVLP